MKYKMNCRSQGESFFKTRTGLKAAYTYYNDCGACYDEWWQIFCGGKVQSCHYYEGDDITGAQTKDLGRQVKCCS
ncbi:MAG: hypothetical protein NTZ74_04425 [Chloroflexi bacterium]|nr:hypothetical protein [Chloroflexota bacterium]